MSPLSLLALPNQTLRDLYPQSEPASPERECGGCHFALGLLALSSWLVVLAVLLP